MKSPSLKPVPGTAKQTAYTMRGLVKLYGSTVEAAEAVNMPESWIWNRLPADDREVKR
jgi:hypothetical protein